MEQQLAVSLPDADLVLRESVMTILWQAGEIYDENGDLTLESYDEKYDLDGLDDVDRLRILTDVYGFIMRAMEEHALEPYLKSYNWAQMCHDYWLTRNGHGAGFWCRGLGDVGKTLSDLAEDGSYDVFAVDGGEDSWSFE